MNLNNSKRSYFLPTNMIKWILVALTPVIVFSCNEKAIQISTPSFQRGDATHAKSTTEGFITLPESQVMFRSVHTYDSLFIDIKIDDNITRNSVLTNGLSVWVDPKSERNQTYGMTFVAARSEMLKRRDEFIRQLAQNNADTSAILMMAARTWVDVVNQRESVIKDKKGTRFADENQTEVFLDNQNNLHYRMKLGLEQLGLTPGTADSISIGVVSNVHVAQMQSSQSSGMNRPAMGSPRSWSQPTQTRPAVMPQIPVNSWIILTLSESIDYNPQTEAETQNP